MTLTLYGLGTCDTCRKARKHLEAADQTVLFVDVRAEPLEDDLLEQFIAAFDKDVINRHSTTWRNLSEEARSLTPLDLLKAHPTLMKRPIIEVGGTLHLGWGKDVQAALA